MTIETETASGVAGYVDGNEFKPTDGDRVGVPQTIR